MLRIDANVEETQAQVELGHTELLKYFKVSYCFSIYEIDIVRGVLTKKYNILSYVIYL